DPDRGSAGIGFQRSRTLSGSGSGDLGERDPLPARALGNAGGADDPGSIASGDRRPFRSGTAPLRAGTIPPVPIDSSPAAGVVTLGGSFDLEAAVGALVEREPRGVHRRSPGCPAR